jgi:hypothetical protein
MRELVNEWQHSSCWFEILSHLVLLPDHEMDGIWRCSWSPLSPLLLWSTTSHIVGIWHVSLLFLQTIFLSETIPQILTDFIWHHGSYQLESMFVCSRTHPISILVWRLLFHLFLLPNKSLNFFLNYHSSGVFSVLNILSTSFYLTEILTVLLKPYVLNIY